MSIRLKSLTWEKRSYYPNTEYAETPFGKYVIHKINSNEWHVEFTLSSCSRIIPCKNCTSLEQVKKIIQKDFSDRIWQCMEIDFKGYTNEDFG